VGDAAITAADGYGIRPYTCKRIVFINCYKLKRRYQI